MANPNFAPASLPTTLLRPQKHNLQQGDKISVYSNNLEWILQNSPLTLNDDTISHKT
jgi:hypothetical protein